MSMTVLLRRPLPTFIGFASLFTASSLALGSYRTPLLCEPRPKAPSSSPLHNSRISPNTVKQISSGSILGLLGGVAVSTFSKPLAFLIGLMVFGTQWMATRGWNVVPTKRIQRYFHNVDLEKAVTRNVPFKMALGVTFMLAAFAEF